MEPSKESGIAEILGDIHMAGESMIAIVKEMASINARTVNGVAMKAAAIDAYGTAYGYNEWTRAIATREWAQSVVADLIALPANA